MHAIVCLTAILFCSSLLLNAQPANFTRSFHEQKVKAIAELKKYPHHDTARVKALLDIANTATFHKERVEVEPYRKEAMELSRKLGYMFGMASCYGLAGSLYKAGSDYANAIKYYDSALHVMGDAGDSRLTTIRSTMFQRKGMIYYAQENYFPALNNFFSSLKYTSDPAKILRLNVFITESYVLLNNLDKAMEYARKNVAMIQRDSSIENDPSSVYFALINIFLQKNMTDSAAWYVDKVFPYTLEPDQGQIGFGYYLKKGHVRFQQQKYADAFTSYKQAYELALQGGHKSSISASLYFLSATALKTGNNNIAKEYAQKNLALADSIDARAGKLEALKNLAGYYHAIGNDRKAYGLMVESMQLKDSLITETNLRQINLLGAIYERETQQREIEQLQNEKEKQAVAVKQKSTLNKFFIISIIALLVLGYLGYMNFRKSQLLAKNKEMMQKQKIIQLEKDKQLSSVDAMLKGQEEERSRIAKDLHDGLGGLLSGAKMSFINVKEKLDLTPENRFLFEKSLSMLDNTILDLRKIAQNLLPEALVKYGLHDAVQDFCDYIHSSTGIKTFYDRFGEQRTLDTTAEVFIFRIIQELVNNVIKHAAASQVIVQLSISDEDVSITVEDDGKGFDKNTLYATRGAGITNINYRVQYFNGTVDMVTAPGCGTSVNIQLIA